ncbi:hypothetical protein BGZ65_003895, partial [Modicella reniformis]
LMLADNQLVNGFEALAEADLQSLVRLDLSGNLISNLDVLKPLVALGNLQHLMLAENDVAEDDYSDYVFEILPQLISVDGFDRDGTEIDVDDDVTLLSGDEEGQGAEDKNGNEDEGEGEYQIDDAEQEQDDEEEEKVGYDEEAAPARQRRAEEDEEVVEEENEDEEIGSNSDSELEDRPPHVAGKGKTAGVSRRADDDDEDDDELEEEDEEEEEEDEDDDVDVQRHQRELGSDEEEEEDEEEEIGDEEDEDEDEEEEEGGEAPGLAYLLTENIQDDNDEEFEPTNEVDEGSEMESSDDEEERSQSSAAAGNNTNGHRTKRPRSPSSTTAPSEFDHSQAGGFDVDDEGDDTTNGFGMASFDGPATFDDETHEAKRPRT